MIATNTAYDNLIAGGASYEWRVVNGSNTWTKDNLISGKLASTLFEKISVGNAISSQLDLSLRNITVDSNSPIVLQFRATQNDGASVSSWYTKGTFYIDTVESSLYSEITKITAFDALIKSEIAYMAEGTWTARTALLIMNGIAADIGVAVESSTASYISNNTITLTASPNIGTDGTTKREMLAYIAAMYGGNFRINASNRLELVRANITPTNTAQVGDAVRDFDASAPETISKVRVWADGQTYYPAPGLPLITHKDEPILTEKGETFLVIAEKYLDEWERLEGQVLDVNLDMYASLAMAERIYRLFDGITYQPFDCPFSFTNPKYEVGDGIKIKDITSAIGNMELDITPLAPSRVAFGRTEALNNKYTYQPSFQRNTTYQLGLLPDKIASAVENQTTLITGGFGGYIKYTYLEDGTPSELLIMDSDKETTAGSIIRLNRNGIGFSTDGGRTYKNAWTIDGHLVADFIDTGTLNAALVKVINLDASNITTGTIDAGQIKVINLDASNITTGTIAADRIATNSIAIGKLDASTQDTINTAGRDASKALTDASTALTNAANAQSIADSASAAAASAQTSANGANYREQIIYRSAASGTTTMTAPTTWITASGNTQNAWTTRRPVYNSSYPVLFVATQRQTVSQSGGTNCTCTTPVIDETTTVIDGGHITTGTIDAGTVNVANINASNITTGTLSADRIAANSIAVGKLTGTITNGGWGINLTNGTMSIGTLAVGSITGNISNGNWKIDFDNGTLSIGNISASNITTGTLNVNDITISGTIKDVPGRNSWNLSTGEFITTLGKIGGFTIGRNSLTSATVQSQFTVVSELTPTIIRFVSQYDVNNYTSAIVGAGAFSIRVSDDYSGEHSCLLLTGYKKYISATSPSSGYIRTGYISLDGIAGNGIQITENSSTGAKAIYITSGTVSISGTTELAYASSVAYKSTTQSFTFGGQSGTTTVYRQWNTVAFTIAMGSGTNFDSTVNGANTLFTLPPGYRPITTQYILGHVHSGTWAAGTYYPVVLYISTDGTVKIQGNATNIRSCPYMWASATYETSNTMPY